MYFWSCLSKFSAAYLCLRADFMKFMKSLSPNSYFKFLLLYRAWPQAVAKNELSFLLDCKELSFGVEISANKSAPTARAELMFHISSQPGTLSIFLSLACSLQGSQSTLQRKLLRALSQA